MRRLLSTVYNNPVVSTFTLTVAIATVATATVSVDVDTNGRVDTNRCYSAQKNCLIVAFLLSTHNICFG